jgi:hypothetical protein
MSPETYLFHSTKHQHTDRLWIADSGLTRADRVLDADLTPELRELVSGIERSTHYLRRLATGLQTT